MEKIIIILISLATPFMAYAQLTLEQCQQKARVHYPEVAQYGLIAKSEEYNISTASRCWIPQITLSGQASWQNNVVTFPDQFTELMKTMGGEGIPGMAKDQYKVAVDVNQMIWDGGVSKYNRELSKAEANEERYATESDIYALEERVNDIFFGILLLDENYKTAEASLGFLESNLKKLNSMYANGVALQSDVNMVKAEIITVNQGMEQNRASRYYFKAMLELFIGEEVGDLAKPVEVIVPIVENRRPELCLLNAKIATLDARKELLKSTLTPKFSIFAQGFYGNPGFDMFAAMTSRDWTWNAILGVRMQWNVSALFTYSTDKKKLDNGRSMLNVQKDVFEFNTKIQSTQQSGEIERMRKSLESDREIVQLRGNIRETAESQFEHGTIDTSTLLQRITEEKTANNMFNIHEIELLKTEYELRHTVNQ